MSEQQHNVLYQETQRFQQRWIWIIVLGLAILTLYAVVQQLILGEPFGNRPAPDWLLAVIAVLLIVILPFFFWRLRLIVEVRNQGIHIRFAGLQRKGKLIRYDEIASFYVRRYRPIREYGGWGIRWGLSGKAYNVSGNEGLQLELTDGKRVLIGSQRARELAAAVANACGREATQPGNS